MYVCACMVRASMYDTDGEQASDKETNSKRNGKSHTTPTGRYVIFHKLVCYLDKIPTYVRRFSASFVLFD